MSYSYQAERPWLFTEEGQVALLKTRDRAFLLCEQAGAFNGMKAVAAASIGDTFRMMAVLDRLVELGDVVELTGGEAWGQERVFVRPRSRR